MAENNPRYNQGIMLSTLAGLLVTLSLTIWSETRWQLPAALAGAACAFAGLYMLNRAGKKKQD